MSLPRCPYKSCSIGRNPKTNEHTGRVTVEEAR